MRSPDLPHDPVPGADVGDRNVERLLGAAYKPEDVDADFARALTGKLCATASALATERNRTDQQTAADERRHVLRRRLGWAMGLAASVAAVALVLYAAERRASLPPGAATQAGPAETLPPVRQANHADNGPGLTPRPRAAAPAVTPLAVGKSLTTRSGERRRVTLTDGSVLYLNQNTQVTQTAPRRLQLAAGEIYVEVAPREQGSGATFIVDTERRKVSALGTRFAVRADPVGTGVLVTQGKVRVSDPSEVVHAGQQLAPGGRHAAPAPRASHQLDWTRELMVAAESPLVPCSQHAGGALIAIDPSGQEMRLTLRKFHVDVHIEDGFARTTIDQTYFNNENDRLEGTFYFPLPPDASLSRLAMYVAAGGEARLMEGGMAERDHARGVFESIRHARRDPALLEWVDGSTFKMRVFPLEGRQEKRIILSYSQRLASLYGVTRYRFPAGHNMDFVKEWSFAARVKHGAAQACSSPTHPALKLAPQDGDMVLSIKEKHVKPDRDVALEILDKTTAAQREEVARFSGFTHEDQQYLMLRYVPKLVGAPRRERRDWVILFESAANRDPLLARAQIEVIRTLLSNAEHDDTFHLLTAATRTHLFDKQARPATAANIQAAMKFLDGAHLIGALDLAGALKTAEPLLKAGKNPYLLHVGAGAAAVGERREDALAKRIPDGVRYVGVGVGKRWGRAFMKAAADRTGGYFTQINPDEPIAWRAFDLLATLNTPRLMELRVVDDAERAPFLCDAASLAQGEEICALTRVKKGAALPETVTVAGKLDGKPFVCKLRVREVADGAGYLPRTWAKLEIDRLLAEDGARHKKTVIELSKAMYVMSPYTSLLVLETDADYARFNVDRGRKDHWAMYRCAERIPIVHEPLWVTVPAGSARGGPKRPVAEVLGTVLLRVPPQPLTRVGQPNVNALPALTALHLYAGAHALPIESQAGEVKEGGRLGKSPGKGDRFQLLAGLDDWRFRLRAGRDMAERPRPEVPREKPPSFDESTAGIQFAPGWKGEARERAIPPGVSRPTRFGPALRKMSGDGLDPLLAILRDRGKDLEGDGRLTAENLRTWQLLFNEEQQRINLNQMMTVKQLEKVIRDQKRVRSEDRRFSREGKRGIKKVTDQRLAKTLEEIRGGGFRKDPMEGLKDPAEFFLRREFQRLTESGNYLYLLSAGKGGELPLSEEGRGLALETGGKERKERDAAYVDLWAHQLFRRLEGGPRRGLLYERPIFLGDVRFFGDLVGSAPGLNTSRADIETVLEAEAALGGNVLDGAVDPRARALIERARAGGWQAVKLPATGTQAASKVVFNAAGQYAVDHILSNGLREIVVCDGATLLHLYPELGLGGRRAVSRAHRADFTDLIPWLLPPVEDLARGADLKSTDERTVVIVSRGAEGRRDGAGKPIPYARLSLQFAADGRLLERRVVAMPAGKTLSRETYGADGTVRLYRGDEPKAAAVSKLPVAPAAAPDLTPDTHDLVLVPMPLRDRNHLYTHSPQSTTYANFDEETAVALIATECALNNGPVALQLFGERFHARGDRRLGFYTLLTASSVVINPTQVHKWNGQRVQVDIVWEHPKSPLAMYLAYHHDLLVNGDRSELGGLDGPADGFVQRLAAFRDLRRKWLQAGKDATPDRAEVLAYLKKAPSPLFAWALLDAIEGRSGGSPREFLEALADARRTAGDAIGLGYAARYEHARSLLAAGDHAQGREAFRRLHADALKAGVVPPIDSTFREALLKAPAGEAGWLEWMRKAALRAAKDHGPLTTVGLAWQAHQLGDLGLAEELFGIALTGAAAGDERRLVGLAGVEYLLAAGQHARAGVRLETLLKDETLGRSPRLWRLAGSLATRRNLPGRAIVCLEKALDLEYRDLPEVVNLETLRADYGALLSQYQQMAVALTMLDAGASQEFLAKVVRAADRWRALDPDGTAVCQAAGKTLRTVGARDLAWDYLTTPIGLRPNEAAPWVGLAQSLRDEGEFDLADRAYTTAFESERTNAQILWDRAQNLQQAGRQEEARRVYRDLADGTWQERFQGLRNQARVYLEGR